MSISEAADILQKQASLNDGLQEFTARPVFSLGASATSSLIADPREDQNKRMSWSKKNAIAVGRYIAQASTTIFYVLTLASYAMFAFGCIIAAATVGRVMPCTCGAFGKLLDGIAPSADDFSSPSSCKACQCSKVSEDQSQKPNGHQGSEQEQ